MILMAFFVVIFLLSFWQPVKATSAFILIFLLLEGFIEVTGYRLERKVKFKDKGWTTDEDKILKKYCFFFTWPMTARKLSSVFTFVYLSSFILVPFLLWHHIWLNALIIGLNAFVARHLSKQLNPVLFLEEEIKKISENIRNGERVRQLRNLSIFNSIIKKFNKD